MRKSECAAGFVLFFVLAEGIAGYNESPPVKASLLPFASRIQLSSRIMFGNLGGKVQYQQYGIVVDAIQADIPDSAIPWVMIMVGNNKISEDSVIALPGRSVLSIRSSGIPQSDDNIAASASASVAARVYFLS